MYQLSLIVKKASIVSFINQSSASGNMFVITLPDEYTQNAYLSQPLQQFLDNESFQDIEIQIRSSFSDLIPFDSVPNFFSSSYNEPLENLLKKRGEDNRSYPGFYYPNQEPGSPLTSFVKQFNINFFKNIVVLYISLMREG